MKRVLVLGALAVAALAMAATISVDTLLKNKNKYDGKDVVVSGKVAEYKARTSRAGNPYITFKLRGASATANIYLRGKLEGNAAPKDGDKVEVSGVYRKEKKVSENFTSKDEIDASPVEKKKFGVKIVERAKK